MWLYWPTTSGSVARCWINGSIAGWRPNAAILRDLKYNGRTSKWARFVAWWWISQVIRRYGHTAWIDVIEPYLVEVIRSCSTPHLFSKCWLVTYCWGIRQQCLPRSLQACCSSKCYPMNNGTSRPSSRKRSASQVRPVKYLTRRRFPVARSFDASTTYLLSSTPASFISWRRSRYLHEYALPESKYEERPGGLLPVRW